MLVKSEGFYIVMITAVLVKKTIQNTVYVHNYLDMY